mgnify:CR=1 FL=1
MPTRLPSSEAMGLRANCGLSKPYAEVIKLWDV